MAEQRIFTLEHVTIYNQDASLVYQDWPTPDVIVSDGGYGVSGFKGDAREPAELKAWYLGHIQSWSRSSRPGTTLWFWNTEIGWAIVHPVLDEHGWEYVGCNIWNKRAIRKPDLWYHDGDHAVLMRSNLVCHDVHFDPIQRIMRPI